MIFSFFLFSLFKGKHQALERHPAAPACGAAGASVGAGFGCSETLEADVVSERSE